MLDIVWHSHVQHGFVHEEEVSHYAPCNFVLLLKMVFKLRTAVFTRCGDAARRTNPQVHVGKKAI